MKKLCFLFVFLACVSSQAEVFPVKWFNNNKAALWIDAVKQGGSATLSDLAVTNSATLPSPFYITSLVANSGAFTNLTLGGVTRSQWGIDQISADARYLQLTNVVQTLSGDETNAAPSVSAVNDGLAAAKISWFNDSPQWVYFTSVSYTFPQTEGGTFIWVAPYFNANNDTGSIRVPTGATNAVFSLKFGVDSAGTNSIRVSVVERWLKPTGQPTGSDTVGLYIDTFMYTTNIVTFNYPILNSGTNRQGQLMFRTLTPTNGTAFSTNGLWVTDVVFQ